MIYNIIPTCGLQIWGQHISAKAEFVPEILYTQHRNIPGPLRDTNGYTHDRIHIRKLTGDMYAKVRRFLALALTPRVEGEFPGDSRCLSEPAKLQGPASGPEPVSYITVVTHVGENGAAAAVPSSHSKMRVPDLWRNNRTSRSICREIRPGTI